MSIDLTQIVRLYVCGMGAYLLNATHFRQGRDYVSFAFLLPKQKHMEYTFFLYLQMQ
jgi:hypothetical protein